MVLISCLVFGTANAFAATRIVTKTADTDDGVCNADCSLREAIDVSMSGDRIIFSALFLVSQVIALDTNSPYRGELVISNDITIIGPGSHLLTISSGGSNGGWHIGPGSVNLSGITITGAGYYAGIENSGNLTIEGCRITGNTGSGGIRHSLGTLNIFNSTISENAGYYAGGIQTESDLTITDSTVSNNTGTFAGGIKSEGDLTITNSTISNNTANGDDSGAGGIYNASFLTLTNTTISGNAKLGGDTNGGAIFHVGTTRITSCTITNNSADGPGSASGIVRTALGSVLSVSNSIIAANVDNATKADVVDSQFGLYIASYGYNLVGNDNGMSIFSFRADQCGTAAAPLDPQLDPLDYYGGPTETHRLRTTSTAIDQGDNFALIEDQRGFGRPFDRMNYPNAERGDGTDIGAYELQFAVLVAGVVEGPLGNPIKNTLVLITNAAGESRSARTDRLGRFSFKNVPSYKTYRISATHREYDFVPQIVTVREQSVNNLTLTAMH